MHVIDAGGVERARSPVMDANKARRSFGFEPPPAFETGLRETIDWDRNMRRRAAWRNADLP
jgi:nucleoside-diphosphate-sugar epimerase